MNLTHDAMGGSETDRLANALTAVIAGRLNPQEFEQLLCDVPAAPGFVELTLRLALTRQDWDAVDALLPFCAARPDERYAQVLCDILDRQCLEISNRELVAALSAVGSPLAVPALTRALSRTTTPHPDWVPDVQGNEQVQEFVHACRQAIAAISD